VREDETWEDLVRRFGEERAIELFLEGLILQKSRAGKKAQGALVRRLGRIVRLRANYDTQ